MWKFRILLTLLLATAAHAQAESLHVSVGSAVQPPMGWTAFCAELPNECDATPTNPDDVVLTERSWDDLLRINSWVNATIKPMTDLQHWGVVEKWSYPDDGYGDCEDYALLKRRMLIAAGWPRSALLMTVVREINGNGHAVLMVKTDRGDFVLDNQNPAILRWSQTNYRFVKRQSQAHQNRWVALDDSRAHPSMVSSTKK